MNEQNLILSLSMDEAPDSTIARDASPSAANGTVTGDAHFRNGRNGGALHCDGGHCDVERNLVDFSEDFTIEAWIRQGKTEPTQTKLGILVRTGNGPDDYTEAWYQIPAELGPGQAGTRHRRIRRIHHPRHPAPDRTAHRHQPAAGLHQQGLRPERRYRRGEGLPARADRG